MAQTSSNTLNLEKRDDTCNQFVNFELPDPGNYKITMEGQRGFSFRKEAELVFLRKSVSIEKQLDNPADLKHKPSDSVPFRVIVLDSDDKGFASGRRVACM